MNYYPHHIGDYLRDTAHLSALEDGIYRRLLDLYYASEKPLPLDLNWLCRLIRVKPTGLGLGSENANERQSLEIILREFFEKREDGWHNKRADEEIRKARKRIKAAKTNGKLGGRKETQKEPSGLPSGMLVGSQKKAHQKPKAKEEKKELTLPDWVPEDAWRAWLEVRSRNKAPNTPRALTLAVRSLEQLKGEGQDPRAVLEQATLRGWRGLFPVKESSNESPLYRREGVM